MFLGVLAHDHAAVVVEHLYTRLVDAFPLKRRRLSKHFLSEETSTTHSQIASLSQACSALAYACLYSNAVLRCAFQAWGARVPVVAVFQGSWLHNLRLSIAPSSFMLAGVCGASAVAIVPSLTDEAERASPGQLHVSIKKVLAKEVSKRRTSAASSPCDSGGGAVRYS